jgi:hypothetical protein
LGDQTKTATGGPQIYDVGTIAVSMTTAKGGLSDNSEYHFTPPTINSMIQGNVDSDYTIPSHIAYYQITGTIRDANSGAGLQGITFNPCDQCEWWTNSCPVTTDSAGHFGPTRACVYGTGQNGSPGEVRVEIPPGQSAPNTGYSYAGDATVQTVTNPPHPYQSINLDFQLSRAGGGM